MNIELLKDFYNEVEGVWPDGWESVIVSTKKNSEIIAKALVDKGYSK